VSSSLSILLFFLFLFIYRPLSFQRGKNKGDFSLLYSDPSHLSSCSSDSCWCCRCCCISDIWVPVPALLSWTVHPIPSLISPDVLDSAFPTQPPF
jgi:hypothetical protein